MELSFRLASLRRLQVLIISFLAYCGVFAEAWEDVFAYEDTYDIVNFMGLSYETNLPTWFVCSALFSCAVLLVLITVQKSRQGARFLYHWGFLAFAFAYISLDEFVSLHEELNSFFRYESSALHFGWVVPAACIVAVIGLSYIPFLLHLPKRTRLLMMLAGGIYVGGALGVELVLGWWTDTVGDSNFVYGMIDLTEEIMEISGVNLFFYTLIDYLVWPGDRLGLTLGRFEPPPPPPLSETPAAAPPAAG